MHVDDVRFTSPAAGCAQSYNHNGRWCLSATATVRVARRRTAHALTALERMGCFERGLNALGSYRDLRLSDIASLGLHTVICACNAPTQQKIARGIPCTG
jgi:hypothetical protein